MPFTEFGCLAAASPVATQLCKDSVDVHVDEGCSDRWERTGIGSAHLNVTVCQVKHQLLVNTDCIEVM